MFTYNHWHPRMLRDGKPIMGAPLYSGHGAGLNNPALEDQPGGPIPGGQWRIVGWHDNYVTHDGRHLGDCVAVLEPVGHDAHNRTGFLIHGVHANDHFDSSEGCICAGLAIRMAMRDFGDTDLLVTNGIEKETPA